MGQDLHLGVGSGADSNPTESSAAQSERWEPVWVEMRLFDPPPNDAEVPGQIAESPKDRIQT